MNQMAMKEGTDPNKCLVTDVWDLANKLEYIGEGITEA